MRANFSRSIECVNRAPAVLFAWRRDVREHAGSRTKHQVFSIVYVCASENLRRWARGARLGLYLVGSLSWACFAAASPVSTEAVFHASDIQRHQEQKLEMQRERAAQRPDILSAPDPTV